MNCEHRRGYEFDWKNMKPCSLCEPKETYVEPYEECRKEGFRDARDGVYRPEAYAGVAKNGYRRGKEDWVELMAKDQT